MLMDASISGPMNLVGPDPVTSADFAKTLGGLLGRPAVLPLPSLAVKTLFGEMGETVLLQGQRADNRGAREAGFAYRFDSLRQALSNELGLLGPESDDA